MISYEEFKTRVKEQVLKELKMTEKQFVTDGFVKKIQVKTNEKSERTVVCFALLEADSYSTNEVLSYMPPCFRNENYAYERDFITEISRAMTPYERISEEERYDRIIETHITQFLQGVKYTCGKQSYRKKCKSNNEISDFCYEYGLSIGNKKVFTYLDDSPESLATLKDFDEFIEYFVKEIVAFSKRYNFYLFSEIENPEMKEKIKIERMKDDISFFLNSLSDKTKGIQMLEEILIANK